MDLRNMVRIVLGHPFVVILGLALTVGSAAFLVSRVTPEYEAKASVVLVTPSSTESPQGPVVQNPLETPGRVAVAANALTDVMLSPQFAEKLANDGLTGSYEVAVSPNGGGAILAVRTTGPTAAAAYDGMNLVLRELGSELEDFQERFGFDRRTFIEDNVLTANDEATPISGSKTRVLAITVALGLVATYGLALLADTIYGERHVFRRRKAKPTGHDRTDETADADARADAEASAQERAFRLTKDPRRRSA